MGPYNQAIKVGNLLFCSGSLGLEPSTGKLVSAQLSFLKHFRRRTVTDIRSYGHKVEGGVEAQATKALQNLKAVVEAGGGELGKVVKTTVRPNFFSTPPPCPLPHDASSREGSGG